MSEVDERPMLVMAGYGRHRSQWVKVGLQTEGAQNRHLETVIN